MPQMTNPTDELDTLDALANLPKFTGIIYYVDAGQPNDTGDGLTPATAKKTITAAEALLTAGDAITIGAGTYAENVVLNVASGVIRWHVHFTPLSDNGWLTPV